MFGRNPSGFQASRYHQVLARVMETQRLRGDDLGAVTKGIPWVSLFAVYVNIYIYTHIYIYIGE